MMVWTGLILRAENEDQLAYVLGHELGHYLRRHSVQRWRAIRAATDASSFFGVLAAAAGVPALGAAGSYAALGSVLAYSRDQEREADEIGLEMMAGAGYDPAEAPRIWEALMAERAAENDTEPSIFFSTHPSNEERLERLRRQASAYTSPRRPAHDPAAHRRILARHAADWLADEERKREFGAFLVLLDRLDRAHDRPGLLAYFRGEVYRLRGEEGDLARAAEAYARAAAVPRAPVAAKRALGLVLWRQGRHPEARRAFEAYLAAAPGADDRQMVESYLLQLGD
jgi:predicted Zn-dependent protease